jgi:hypothetical protein
MKMKNSISFLLGGAAALLLAAVVRAPSRVATAQEGVQKPFANPIEQRQQIVEELRKLNGLMQKQIDLLTSGKVRVIVVERAVEGKADRKAP